MKRQHILPQSFAAVQVWPPAPDLLPGGKGSGERGRGRAGRAGRGRSSAGSSATSGPDLGGDPGDAGGIGDGAGDAPMDDVADNESMIYEPSSPASDDALEGGGLWSSIVSMDDQELLQSSQSETRRRCRTKAHVSCF